MRRKKENMWNQAQRFSIRKFSFGVTSVLLGTVFLANTAMADEVSGISNDSQPKTADTRDGELINPAQPVQPTQPVDQPAENVVQPVQPTQPAVQPELAQPTEKVEKTVEVKKDQLTELVSDLLTLLGNINRDKVSKTSLLEYESVLSKAQEVLQNESATQLEVDAQVRKVRSAISIAKSFPKVKSTTEENIVPKTGNDETLVTPKTETEIKHSLETVKEDLQKYVKKSEVTTNKPNVTAAEEILENISKQLENTTLTSKELTALLEQAKTVRNSLVNEELRATSGARDSRNNRSMGEGSDLRAANVSSTWTSKDNLLIYQRFRASDGDGNIRNDDRQFSENKVDMTARIETIGGAKYVVYDIFFNNDGKSMVKLSKQQAYRFMLQPKILDLNSNGSYKQDDIRDLHFDIYHRKNENETGTLSQNPEKFNYERRWDVHFLNDNESSINGFTYYNSLGVRASGSHAQDMKDIFKGNKNDPYLEEAVKLEGVYRKYSYGLGVITNDPTAAVHMHLKAKLRPGVTDEEVRKAFTIAVASTYGETTKQSYVFGSGKKDDEHVEPTVKQSSQYPIKGKEVTTTVGESLGNVSDPVASGFVVRNDDTKNFPDGMHWNWTSEQPNTSTAGIFTYNVTATYYDNSSNSTTATLKVKPKKPVITASEVEHKKGLTGQSIRVNVGSGVKANSTVKLYEGNTLIGTGTTNGETATVTVSGALSGNPITAETIVNNGGEVTSVRSEAVTPTEVPDSVAPTVTINGKALTTNADENRFIIYRGANFNPTFEVRDDKNNVTLTITNLPNGVGNISESGSKEFNYIIPDNTVADDASFGESTANVTATDGHNTVTYKFKYRIVDIQAKNSTTENRTLGSALGNPQDHFKVAESNTADNDKYYPDNMQFKWKVINLSTFTPTDVPNNTKLNEVGTITKYYATAVFPTNTVNRKSIDGVNYTIYTPAQKPVQMTFNVTDNVKPIVKLVGDNGSDTTLSESTPEASLPKVTVYRGENATITVKASDNTGKVQNLTITNLPTGLTPVTNNRTSDTATDATPLTKTTTGKVDKTATVEVKVATVTVSDKSTPANATTVKFKVDVKEQKDKYTPTTGTTVKVGNIGTISQPDGDKIKDAVTVPDLSAEATRDGGITKTLKDNGRVTTKNGKNYVTVEVAYPDGSKDEVDVAVEEVLKAGEKNPTNKAVDGQPYISNEKVINPNKEDAKFTATLTNGLTVGTDGKVSGKPTGIKWTGNETEKIVKIPVTVTRTGETPVKVEISVVVQRDITKTPTFTVGEQNPKTGSVEVTVGGGVPDGAKVTLPGVSGEKTVENGKVVLTNNDLPTTATTGKGSAQESGKLPKEGTSEITIPAKLVESATPTFSLQEPRENNGDVKYKVTKPGGEDYPQNSKVNLNGKDYTVGVGGIITVPNADLPETKGNYVPTATETGKLPKDGNTVEVPAKLTSLKGESLIQKDLSELKEITTVWKDEQGNVLKPAITATPKDMGIKLSSFEHGEIEGYVFVETKVEGNVVTHIFRKVTSTRPEGNGDNKPQPTPEAPTDNTERKPEVVTPDEQPAETENTTTKPKASQNILPNTGTAKGVGIFSAAAASILSGLGLLVFGKKEDEEEENN